MRKRRKKGITGCRSFFFLLIVFGDKWWEYISTIEEEEEEEKIEEEEKSLDAVWVLFIDNYIEQHWFNLFSNWVRHQRSIRMKEEREREEKRNSCQASIFSISFNIYIFFPRKTGEIAMNRTSQASLTRRLGELIRKRKMKCHAVCVESSFIP